MGTRRGVTGKEGERGPRRRVQPRRRRAALVRGLVVLGVLAAVLAGVVGWRASGIVKLLLRNWAVEAVAQQSGGVYRLDVGRVRLNWLLRRVAVDSVRLTTNVGVNAKRVPPLLDLKVAFDRCTLSGVHLVALVLGRGFVGRVVRLPPGQRRGDRDSRPSGGGDPTLPGALEGAQPARERAAGENRSRGLSRTSRCAFGSLMRAPGRPASRSSGRGGAWWTSRSIPPTARRPAGPCSVASSSCPWTASWRAPTASWRRASPTSGRA